MFLFLIVRLWGWIFQDFYPNRGWYRVQNSVVGGYHNTIHGPYASFDQAVLRNSPLLYTIMYRLTMPIGTIDVRKNNR